MYFCFLSVELQSHLQILCFNVEYFSENIDVSGEPRICFRGVGDYKKVHKEGKFGVDVA